MQKINSIRVAYENWLYDDRFKSLLGLLEKYPCGIGQVALFSSMYHTPLTLDELSRRAEIMKVRIRQIKDQGLSGGINLLATIGHHNENLDGCFDGQYSRMTNIDSAVCRGSFCMNDHGYLADYIVPVYTTLAMASPDFIWVDDDVRYGHMPIGNGCFCDKCIKLFNSEVGAKYDCVSYDRASLRAALDSGDIKVRKQWLRHNSDAISRLLALIGRTVRGVDENITLGFMTGERYFEGYDFAAFADALSDGGKYKIMWRPGGGAYEDRSFDDIVAKTQDINRQNAYLPPYVSVIQSEIENFPYQLIKKTPKSTASEAVLHMTAGCTGAAFNILPSETLEPVEGIEAHLKAIDKLTPFYSLLADKLASTKARGIHTGWRIDSQAALPPGNWTQAYGGAYASYARELFSFGFPEGADIANADAVTLTGCEASAMTDAEIIKLLSGGLYLDAGALAYLNSRGFGEYTGFAVGKAIDFDARETYIASDFNRGIESGIRNCRQAFYPGDSFSIIPQNSECLILSKLIDYNDRTLCDCCTGIFTNKIGGRVCAAGYYPFSWVSDIRKTIQLKRIFTFLSGGGLISFVDSYCRLHNFTRTGGGKLYCALFNPSNDATENVSVCVLTDKNKAVSYDQNCIASELRSSERLNIFGGKYQKFTVPIIKSYETVLVEI
jgi:hypothetical protein